MAGWAVGRSIWLLGGRGGGGGRLSRVDVCVWMAALPVCPSVCLSVLGGVHRSVHRCVCVCVCKAMGLLSLHVPSLRLIREHLLHVCEHGCVPFVLRADGWMAGWLILSTSHPHTRHCSQVFAHFPSRCMVWCGYHTHKPHIATTTATHREVHTCRQTDTEDIFPTNRGLPSYLSRDPLTRVTDWLAGSPLLM